MVIMNFGGGGASGDGDDGDGDDGDDFDVEGHIAALRDEISHTRAMNDLILASIPEVADRLGMPRPESPPSPSQAAAPTPPLATGVVLGAHDVEHGQAEVKEDCR